MISNTSNNPIQFIITFGCESDIGAFRKIDLNLSVNSLLYIDKTYNDYKYENNLIYQNKYILTQLVKAKKFFNIGKNNYCLKNGKISF